MTTTEYRVTRYRATSDIVHGVLGKPGHKYTPLVGIIGDGVRLIRVPNDEVTKYVTDLLVNRGIGPKRYAKKLLDAGKRMGITKEAKDFLREIQ